NLPNSSGGTGMKHVAGLLVTSAAIFFLALGPALAQHTVAAKFDLTKPISLKGTVTQIDWANPYTHVLMKVPAASGPPALWAVELESPILLAKNGWSQTTVQPGDVITVDGYTVRNGTKQVWGKSVMLGGKSVLTGYNG